jgi:hypothetical protein
VSAPGANFFSDADTKRIGETVRRVEQQFTTRPPLGASGKVAEGPIDVDWVTVDADTTGGLNLFPGQLWHFDTTANQWVADIAIYVIEATGHLLHALTMDASGQPTPIRYPARAAGFAMDNVTPVFVASSEAGSGSDSPFPQPAARKLAVGVDLSGAAPNTIGVQFSPVYTLLFTPYHSWQIFQMPGGDPTTVLVETIGFTGSFDVVTDAWCDANGLHITQKTLHFARGLLHGVAEVIVLGGGAVV